VFFIVQNSFAADVPTTISAGDADFAKKVQALVDSAVSSEEPQLRWQEVKASQDAAALVPISTLIEIFDAQMAALGRVRLRANVHRTRANAPSDAPPGDVQYRFEFAVAGPMLLKSIEHQTTGRDATDRPTVVTYDGTVFRHSGKLEGSSWGSIDPVGDVSSFYTIDMNPLGMAMLIDTAAVFGNPAPSYDIRAFLQSPATIVLADTRPHEDTDVVVCTDLSQDVYLDVARNFAVRRIDRYQHHTNGERYLTMTRTCSDLVEAASGAWLPRQIEEIRYDRDGSGQTTATYSIDVTDYATGPEEVPDRMFTEVFPEGTHVVDGVNDTRYFVGPNQSIEDVLNRTIPGQGPPESRWHGKVFVALNAVLAVSLVGFLLWRRSRRRLGMSQDPKQPS